MIDQRIEAAILHFENLCFHSDHGLCGDSRVCTSALTAIGEAKSSKERAARFDVGREVLARGDEMPDQTWPTTTLLAFVHRHLLNQPNVRGLWRATAITTALARLAERGIPADCVVRTCIGPTLLRRILMTTSATWLATRAGDIPRDRIPELEGWFQLFDDNFGEIDGSADHTYISTLAMKGAIRATADTWLADASITHIVGWRLDGYLHVDPVPASLELPCGLSGTRWIYERSVLTYPAEWHPDSRVWESAYTADAQTVTEFIGLPRSILAERTVTPEALARAQLEVVSGRTKPLIEDMIMEEIIETIVSMMETGMFAAARDLARRANEKRPNDPHIQLVYAFCTIPFDCDEAEGLLISLSQLPNNALLPVVQLDLAAVALMQGRQAAALEIAASIARDQAEAPQCAWLWEPGSLPHEPRIMYGSAEDWLNRLRTQIAEQS